MTSGLKGMVTAWRLGRPEWPRAYPGALAATVRREQGVLDICWRSVQWAPVPREEVNFMN